MERTAAEQAERARDTQRTVFRLLNRMQTTHKVGTSFACPVVSVWHVCCASSPGEAFVGSVWLSLMAGLVLPVWVLEEACVRSVCRSAPLRFALSTDLSFPELVPVSLTCSLPKLNDVMFRCGVFAE